MNRLLIIFLIIFSIIFASNVNAGELSKGFYFIGLWQGIDPADGSEAQRSITLNRDGSFNIIGYETYFIGCEGGRGLITATGVLEGGVIFSDDFTLTCFGDNPPGPFTDIEVKYIPDKLNRTLKESFINSSFEPEILHKISKR
jgi:hypothetical protein